MQIPYIIITILQMIVLSEILALTFFLKKKALQALEQAASPSYRHASPLLKEAGTPAPFLPSMKKELCKYILYNKDKIGYLLSDEILALHKDII